MSNIIKSEQSQLTFTEEQVALIKKQIAPNATDSELKLFLYQCQRTGLDPLTRQIYCIHRGGKMTVQTSIDGFRVIAERSGDYAGQDEPVFTYDEKGNILKCSVTVYRFSPQGQRYPAAVGVAFWNEYAQQGPLWSKMKHTMLSKCAEALALRKAYPQDLSGLYTGEEMQQADAPAYEAQMEDVSKDMPDPSELKMLIDLVYTSNLPADKKEETLEYIATKVHNYKTFQALLHKLEDAQPSIDEIPNPSQTDLKKHIKKIAV